jgi:Sulfate permease family
MKALPQAQDNDMRAGRRRRHLVGVICVVAGVCRAGFVANFLSRPILIGFLSISWRSPG